MLKRLAFIYIKFDIPTDCVSYTMKGAGQDIQTGGKKLEIAADKAHYDDGSDPAK